MFSMAVLGEIISSRKKEMFSWVLWCTKDKRKNAINQSFPVELIALKMVFNTLS